MFKVHDGLMPSYFANVFHEIADTILDMHNDYHEAIHQTSLHTTTCSLPIRTLSALGVSHVMRSINLRYLLIYYVGMQ